MVATIERATGSDQQTDSAYPLCEGHRLLADLVGSNEQPSWKRLVPTAADEVVGDAWTEAAAPMHAIIKRLWNVDRKLASEIDEALGHFGAALSVTYPIAGYALARSWPDSAEGLDSWADRARKFIDGE